MHGPVSNKNARLNRTVVVLQILTDTQQAACIVRAFPYISEDLRLFEVLAAQRNEVPVSTLTHAAGLSDFDHEINWLQVPIYLNKVTSDRFHEHVELKSSSL